MSYSSESFLPEVTRQNDLRQFVLSLGFKRIGAWKHEGQRFEDYYWFEEAEYRSWSGVELSICLTPEPGGARVSTRTPISRSYYDLVQQNETIAAIRKRFGGTFRTDEGSGRYLRPNHGPPPPSASGCHLAFARFGSNLIKAGMYLQAREFKHPLRITKETPRFLQEVDPEALSNNMVVSFLVSIVEDYLKSTFVAMLRHSTQKDRFLRGVRLQGDQLTRIADGEITVEQTVSETLPFQRISAAVRHFGALDKELDIAGALRRPFRRRRTNFFELLEGLVERRHAFVHRATLDLSVTQQVLTETIHDLDTAVTRIYDEITRKNRWPNEKTWALGRRPRRSALPRKRTSPAQGQ